MGQIHSKKSTPLSTSINLVTVQKRSLWIPMPVALSLFVLVASHPKLQSFVQLCAWSMLLLGPKPPLAHYPAFIYSLPCNNFVQKVITQVKKLCLFVTAFKDLHVSWVPKNQIIIPQAAHQAMGTCFHVVFQRFAPPLCNYSHSPAT
jgi:hypothetical protein